MPVETLDVNRNVSERMCVCVLSLEVVSDAL